MSLYIIIYMSALKHIHVQEMVGRWLNGLQMARRLGLAPEVGDEAWLGPCHAAKTTRWNPETNTLWLFNIAMENGPFIDGLPGFTY